MYHVLVLICAMSLQHTECTVHTAIDVIQGPDAVDAASCGMQSQAYLADTAVGRELRSGREYPKILCIRSGIQPGNVG